MRCSDVAANNTHRKIVTGFSVSQDGLFSVTAPALITSMATSMTTALLIGPAPGLTLGPTTGPTSSPASSLASSLASSPAGGSTPSLKARPDTWPEDPNRKWINLSLRIASINTQ